MYEASVNDCVGLRMLWMNIYSGMRRKCLFKISIKAAIPMLHDYKIFII